MEGCIPAPRRQGIPSRRHDRQPPRHTADPAHYVCACQALRACPQLQQVSYLFGYVFSSTATPHRWQHTGSPTRELIGDSFIDSGTSAPNLPSTQQSTTIQTIIVLEGSTWPLGFPLAIYQLSRSQVRLLSGISFLPAVPPFNGLWHTVHPVHVPRHTVDPVHDEIHPLGLCHVHSSFLPLDVHKCLIRHDSRRKTTPAHATTRCPHLVAPPGTYPQPFG